MPYVNKYAKRCGGCGVMVAEGKGFITKPNGTWLTWCPQCCPERLAPTTPVVRRLTLAGEVFTPYEPSNLPLLRSFPGARWDGGKKCWVVSLAPEDRGRVLELADRLGLDVPAELRKVETPQAALVAQGKGLYPFQIAGVSFLASGEKRLLADDMGCIDGDAIVHINRAGAGRKMTLAKLCHKFNGGESRGRSWDMTFPVYIRSLCNGEFRLNRIHQVLDKGIKTVVRLQLRSGKEILLTPDHEVRSEGPCGEEIWIRADKLAQGDKVLTESPNALGAKEPNSYPQVPMPNFLPVTDYVESVTPAGEKHVFDVVCDDPHRNFVANGIVVHNCGKTVQTLTALPANARALVVCPASLKHNWSDETKKWRPDLKPIIVDGKMGFRLPVAGEVVVMNYDILPTWLTPGKERGEAAPVPAGVAKEASEVILIADEGHRLANYKSLRSKRFKTLSGICKATWLLTGTPLLNRPPQLWGVLEAGGMAAKAFGSWGRFMRLFNAERGRWGIVWSSPSPEVPEMLRRVMLRRTREEVLPDLPRKTYSEIVVNEMPGALRRRMDALSEEWGGYLEEAVTDQVDTALPPFEEFSAIRAELAASRIPALTELIEDTEESAIPLVVASAHRAPIDPLAEREGWAVITGDTKPADRQEVVRRFQAGELKGVGLTIQAGGVGLTLTRAWRMIFVDLDWTPANNLQCEDRLVRISQESDKIEIVRLVSDHPLDRHVQALIARKINLIQGAVENVVEGPAAAMARQLGLDPMTPAGIVWDLAYEQGLPCPYDDRPQKEGETEAQFQARMEAARKAREAKEIQEKMEAEERRRVNALSRAERVRERERNRANAEGRNTLPLTPERTEGVRQAFDFMLGVCDGALRRDGQGFSKPDSLIAHSIEPAGLEGVALEAVYLMLLRYPRQLRSQFPILFG